MKKVIRALSIIAGLVLITAVILLFVDFDSAEMGRAFLAKASETTDIQLSSERFRLNLLRGLFLENVHAEGNLPAGHIEARMNRLVLEHRLLPLLSGKLSVNRLTLEKPSVELIETQPKPASMSQTRKRTKTAESTPAKPSAAPGHGMSLEISEIRVQDASLIARTEGMRNPSTSVRQLDLQLQDLAFDPSTPSAMVGFSAHGQLKAKEVQFETTRVLGTKGQFNLAGGRMEAKELTFTTDQGDFKAALTIDFNHSPFLYSVALEGNPLDTSAVLGKGKEKGSGTGKLKFTGEGFGTESKDMKGKGTLTLNSGTLPSSPALTAIESYLGKTHLVGAPYRVSEAPFRVEHNRVVVEHFKLEMDQAALDLSGWVDLNGPLGLQLVIRAPRQGIKVKEIPNEALDALTDDSGWVAIPFKVSGSSDHPQVWPDSKALMAEAQKGAGKVVKQKLAGKIKSLLSNKPK